MTDMVNNPAHYNREGAMECIDEMILVYGVKATILFCYMNAHKYRFRAFDKNGAEDIAKSDWYINKAKQLCSEYKIESVLNVDDSYRERKIKF